MLKLVLKGFKSETNCGFTCNAWPGLERIMIIDERHRLNHGQWVSNSISRRQESLKIGRMTHIAQNVSFHIDVIDVTLIQPGLFS